MALLSVLGASPCHRFFDCLIDMERLSLQLSTFRRLREEPDVDERTCETAAQLREAFRSYAL